MHSHACVGECLQLELDVFLSHSPQKPGSPTEYGARTWNVEQGLGQIDWPLSAKDLLVSALPSTALGS